MQRTIESIAKRRVKNADRKAKKREIERASLTVEEYAMKNQQRITIHRRKKQLEKYIITVTETWKIKSSAEQRRIQQLQKFKVPMDCVNIILSFVNPNMMYLLFKMTAQMKQIRLTKHFDHCLDNKNLHQRLSAFQKIMQKCFTSSCKTTEKVKITRER